MSGNGETPKGLEALGLISERLGALFKQVQDSAKTGAQAGESEPGATHFSIPTPNGPVPGVISYGFRSGALSSMPRGRAAPRGTRPAADFEVKKPARAEPQQREPVIEIFDEEDHYLLTAELPGVNEAALSIRYPAADEIIIEATGTPKFFGHRKLARAIDSAATGRRFRNGILELTLPFAAPKDSAA